MSAPHTTSRGLEALKTAAAQRLAILYPELDLDLSNTDSSPDGAGAIDAATLDPLPIVASRSGPLWDGLGAACDALGFDAVTSGDAVCQQLVLARIIEPTSKVNSRALR